MKQKRLHALAASLRRRCKASEGNAEEGQGLVEYGLILGLVAVLCVAALTTLQQAIGGSAGFSIFS